MQNPNNLVDMGYIAAAFGLQGWVKIKTTTEYIDSLADYPEVYLKLKDGRVITQTIEKNMVRDGMFHAKLLGVNDRDAALALRGSVVAVARDDFPDLVDDDEYYWVDLIGLKVINLNNEHLGTVKGLLETGANDVLVVSDEQVERLIPFIAQYVVQVDLLNKQLTVDWGLDY